jgi:N-formylglutamate deformylase
MTFQLHRGSAPLLVSMPHVGTEIPPDLRAGYVPRALAVEDTDWHMPQLYAFAQELGASVLQPQHSRYVIDLNRPPDDTPMYPGASNTELCPTRFFTGDALYAQGGPDAQERERRRLHHWQPYHDALAGELDRLRALHGFVLLWDAHSIRSEIPWLFDGLLPDLNIGTASGAAADERITQAVAAVAARQLPGVTHAVNGRFKGGYITRRYGRPAEHVHAVQLEMTQKLYMREAPPYDYLPERAGRIQPVLHAMVDAALQATRALYAR